KSSEAKLKFGGAWTDKNRDVTVVKLGYNKKAREELSTKGTQYKLFVVDNDNKIQKHAKISYGILGTQGDGFLIIDGKLDKKAYQIVMTNQ
ncbi:flagellar biosynthesis protein FliS, partial [Streptococcus anginosus]|nr:flagellar biosynthesis protein FliS [Streptococcus anginosus]